MKGKFDGVSLGRDGRLSLAPKLDTFFTSEQPVIWSVAAGAGWRALCRHRTSRPRFPHRAERDIKAALDRRPARSFCASQWTSAASSTRPVRRTEKSIASRTAKPPNTSIRKRNTSGRWRWRPMARSTPAPATTGKVFRITGAGKGEAVLCHRPGQCHRPDARSAGRLLAGTEPNGILYRITAKDKAFALYDSNLPEIRAVAPNPGWQRLRGRAGRSTGEESAGSHTAIKAPLPDGTPTVTTSITVTADAGGDIKPLRPPSKPQETAPALRQLTTATTAAPRRYDSPWRRARSTASTPITPSIRCGVRKKKTSTTFCPRPDGQLYFATDASGRIYRLTATAS